MKYTTNYNLYKPDYDDTIDVDFLNKNMDVLDNQINGLDYVQNVNTSDTGLTFIKRNGDAIQVPLNYLKLTGGTVTGDTEFTGKLTNNSKEVGRLFCNKKPILTPLMDWDAIANYKGSTTKVQKTTVRNGETVTLSYYSFCTFVAETGVYAYENGDIYLKDPFTNYDKLLVVSLGNNAVQAVKYTIIDCGELEWAMNNLPIVSLTGDSPLPNGYWGIRPYKKWGTSQDVSTPTLFKFAIETTDIVEIYGVKYARD